jgi:hypothetical protein
LVSSDELVVDDDDDGGMAALDIHVIKSAKDIVVIAAPGVEDDEDFQYNCIADSNREIYDSFICGNGIITIVVVWFVMSPTTILSVASFFLLFLS